MLDKTIPFYNTILRCDVWEEHPVSLPDGYAVVPFRPDYARDWARLETETGDFSSPAEAEVYFLETYAGADPEDLLFLKTDTGRIVGAGFAWTDKRQGLPVNSLHWMVIEEAYQGRGLGRALCCAVMNRFARRGGGSVYLHTQPWSWKAILLYLSLGFRLQKSDSFHTYENQYADAIRTLKGLLTEAQYRRLEAASEDGIPASPQAL